MARIRPATDIPSPLPHRHTPSGRTGARLTSRPPPATCCTSRWSCSSPGRGTSAAVCGTCPRCRQANATFRKSSMAFKYPAEPHQEENSVRSRRMPIKTPGRSHSKKKTPIPPHSRQNTDHPSKCGHFCGYIDLGLAGPWKGSKVLESLPETCPTMSPQPQHTPTIPPKGGL